MALVIGGSRGLGAALVGALASQSSTVLLNYSSSQREAEALRDNLAGTKGEVRLLAGDAADHDWCREQSESVVQEFGGLDFLVCNASPVIRPLDFTADTLERFHQFVDQSLRLVTVPLAAFLEPLRLRNGRPGDLIPLRQDGSRGYPALRRGQVGDRGADAVHYHPRRGRPWRSGTPAETADGSNKYSYGQEGRRHAGAIAAKVVALLLDEPAQEDVQIVEDFEIAAK